MNTDNTFNTLNKDTLDALAEIQRLKQSSDKKHIVIFQSC